MIQLDAVQPILWLFISAITISFIVLFVFSWSMDGSNADNKLVRPKDAEPKTPDKILPTFDKMFDYILQAKAADTRRIRSIYHVINTILFFGILVIISGVAFALSESLFGTPALSSLWSVIMAGIAITATAVFMFFSYRSVLLHTMDYYQTVERLTWLGVSTKIFDNLPEDKKVEALSILREVQQSVSTTTDTQISS